MRFCVFILFCATMGCSTLSGGFVQDLNPKVYYKPDIILTFEGKVYNGWGVLPAKTGHHYELEIEAPGTVDLLKVSSCGRFDTDEPRGSIFRNGKKFKYIYRPDIDLELTGSCPLLIEAYEAGKPGRHSYGIFEIGGGDHSLESMPQISKCNGINKHYAGISMCVTLESIKQVLVFDSPVTLMQEKIKESCRIPESPDGKKWIFKTRNRECIYLFRESLGKRRFSRHLAVGFEEIAVRRYK